MDASFNFADFVSDFHSEEFAKVLKINFPMWLLAIFWISFPDGSHVGLWITVRSCGGEQTVL
jgi:hypothetical protein